MKLINLICIAGLLASILSLSACKKWEQPDLNTSLDDLAFDTKLTHLRLSEVRSMYNGNNVTLGEAKITGIVISEHVSLPGGTPINMPGPENHVIIQDQLSGIILDFGESNLKTWPLHRGDSIIVVVTGSTLTRKNGAMYITGLNRAKMQVIGINGNSTGAKNRVMIRHVSIAELLNNFSAYESTLVRVIAEIDPAPVAGFSYGGDKVLKDYLGTSTGIILHTEASAPFANQYVPPAIPYAIPTHGANFMGIAALSSDGTSKQIWMRILGDAAIFTVYGNIEDLEQAAATANSPKPNYATGNVTLRAGSYTLNNAVIEKTADDKKTGNWSVRFANNHAAPAYFQMNFDRPTGATKVTFSYAIYGNDPGSVIQLQYSVDGGVSWVQAGENLVVANLALQTATFKMNIQGNVRFRIAKLGGITNNGRLNIDNFTIYQNTLY